MAIEHVDMKKETSKLNEFQKRKAMSSIEELIKLALKDPLEAVHLIDEYAQGEDPYPDFVCVMYWLGIIRGMSASSVYLSKGLLKDLLSSEHYNKIRPDEYIGPRRKYCKIGGANGLR